MECHEAFGPETVALVLLDIILVVVLARLFGAVCRKISQPTVVGEILAGIALGPSLLGALPGNPTAALFPCQVMPPLTVIATLGLIIFMFIVGLELDPALLRGQGRTAAGISLSSIALPFALGVPLALWLFPAHDVANGVDVDLLPFALFIGVSMSVTAFPVLARILSERGMRKTRTGTLVLAAAAVDDLMAWILLAAVVAVISASSGGGLALMVVESAVFLVVMFLVVRPLLARLVPWRDRTGWLTPDMFSIVLVGILASSLLTEEIGLHFIFGAFVFGAVMPRAGAAQLSEDILVRVEQLTVLILLPVFFIVTGLQVDVTALTRQGWVELLAVLAVACVGKFVGAAAAARLLRVPGRRSAAVGILMNTRGLTELVVLSIGRASDVLDEELYSVLVLMAVITTVMTTPILKRIYPDRMVARDIAMAERAALGLSADHRVVALVTSDDDVPVVDAGVALLGDPSRSELVLSRFDPPFETVEVGSGLTAELAAVAASFEGTQGLAARAGAQGAVPIVRSQFSDDVGRDLLAQVEAADADVVVLPAAQARVVDEVLGGADCAVAVVLGGAIADEGRPPDIARVVAWPSGGEDGLSAVELGCRAALGSGAPLVLADSGDRRSQRRATSLRDRVNASGLGIDARVEPADQAVAGEAPERVIAVVGHSQWREWGPAEQAAALASGTVIQVRAALDDHGEALTHLLEQAPAGAAGETSAP